jgi:hypothetical protein
MFTKACNEKLMARADIFREGGTFRKKECGSIGCGCLILTASADNRHFMVRQMLGLRLRTSCSAQAENTTAMLTCGLYGFQTGTIRC